MEKESGTTSQETKEKKERKTKTEKGKEQTTKEEKGKQNEGKGKSNNPHAGKQCHICHRRGHIAADCWWKVGAVDAETATDTGGTGGSGSAKDNTSGSNTAVRGVCV